MNRPRLTIDLSPLSITLPPLQSKGGLRGGCLLVAVVAAASVGQAFLPVQATARLRSGFPLMMELTDARSLSLGGAALTGVGHPGEASQNPAAAWLEDPVVHASYARHPVGLWSGRLMGAARLKGFTVGGYLSTLDYGTFNEAISSGGATGSTFDAAEQLLGGFVAGDLWGRGSWGVGGKIGWWKIAGESAAGGAFDAGLTFDPRWERVRLGIALRNIGGQWSGRASSRAPTPFEGSLAVSKRLDHLPLTLHGALHLRRSGEGEWDAQFLPGKPGIAFGAGGEFEILPQGARKPFYLRFGYRSLGQGLRVGNRLDLQAGISIGVGIQARHLAIDYTIASLGALGSVHRFGVTGSL